MAFRIEVSTDARKQLGKLDKEIRERIVRFLFDRITKLDDPRSPSIVFGEASAVQTRRRFHHILFTGPEAFLLR